MKSVILFCGVGDEYGAFSNFAMFPIHLDGKLWPSTEHYYQAQKFAAERDRERIRKSSTALAAARLGRDKSKRLRRDWHEVRRSVMLKAVRTKFAQHEELRVLLLSTGDVPLVEHTERDSYWGDGGDGSGKNMLGRMLMEIRDQLRSGS